MGEKKVAIIGASRDRRKFGNKAVRAFLEKGYDVYPIHPTEKEIEGLPAYRSVLEIPDVVPLASFYVPPSIGLKMIEEVGLKAGMKTVYLNPGAEGPDLIEKGKKLGLEMKEVCSILAIGSNPSRF